MQLWVPVRTRQPGRLPGTRPPQRLTLPSPRDPGSATSSEPPGGPPTYPAGDGPQRDPRNAADGEKGQQTDDYQGGGAPPLGRGFLALLEGDRGGQDQPEDDPEDHPAAADPLS